MDKNESLAKNASKITEIVNSTAPPETLTKETLTGYNGLFEVFLMGLFSVAGFYLLYRKSQLRLDKANPPKPNIFKRLAQPSCSKCRFFDRNLDSSFNGSQTRNGLSRNSYLKCAVHPVRVNNTAAQNCPDYWQRDRRKFLHR